MKKIIIYSFSIIFLFSTQLNAIEKKKLTDTEWKGNVILLFGSEGYGIKKHTEKYTDFTVKIKINKEIESLNISNSAAIVFHHLNKIKKLKWKYLFFVVDSELD